MSKDNARIRSRSHACAHDFVMIASPPDESILLMGLSCYWLSVTTSKLRQCHAFIGKALCCLESDSSKHGASSGE
eukprot:scaffold149408_cov27-Prasinocladus_malaysianus.AAC.1